MTACIMALITIASDGLDMTARLQDAIATANASPFSTVELQPGVFPVRADLPGPLFSLRKATTLRGPGATIDASLGVVDGTRVCLAVAPDEAGTLRGLTVTGPPEPGANTTIGIRASAGASLCLDSVTCSGWTHAIRAESDARVVRAQDCDISARQQGYLAVAGTRGVHAFARCALHDIGSTNLHHGLYIEAGFQSVLVSDCTFADISGYGLHRSGGSAASGAVEVSGGTWDRCGSGAVLLDNGAAYSAHVASGRVRTATGIIARSPNAHIEDMTLTCDSTAVIVQGASVRVWGCQSDGSGAHVEVLGTGAALGLNHWWGGGSTAVRVRATGTTIDSDRFYLNGTVGIRAQDGAYGMRVSDSAFYGFTSGTGAVYVDATAANPANMLLIDTLYATDYAVRAEVSGVVW